MAVAGSIAEAASTQMSAVVASSGPTATPKPGQAKASTPPAARSARRRRVAAATAAATAQRRARLYGSFSGIGTPPLVRDDSTNGKLRSIAPGPSLRVAPKSAGVASDVPDDHKWRSQLPAPYKPGGGAVPTSCADDARAQVQRTRTRPASACTTSSCGSSSSPRSGKGRPKSAGSLSAGKLKKKRDGCVSR